MLLPKNNTIAGENSLNSGNARSYVSATPVTVTVGWRTEMASFAWFKIPSLTSIGT